MGNYQYLKIKDYILKNIEMNKYKDGKIESENELVHLFDVSRMTVRQALTSLQQEGIIYTLPKKGSYVSKKEKFKELDGLHSFSEDVKKLKGNISSQIILCQKEKTEDYQTLSLNLSNQHQEVWHVIRVRYLDDTPIAYEDGYYNGALILDIPENILKKSLYEYFEDELNLQIDYSLQDIDACLAREFAGELQVTPEAPLLRVHQTTYLKDGQCLEYAYTYYRVDMFTFTQKAYRRKKR